MFRRRERRAAESGPYYKQRSWRLSAGFIGVVVVVGVIGTLTSGHSDTTHRATTAASVGPLSDTSATKGGRPRDCRTDDSAGDVLPTSVPKDVSWQTLGISRVPVSASAGPTRTDGDLWWCFAHTPTGAALAAHIIPSQMSGPGWRTVTKRQVVEGNGRKMFEFIRSTVQDTDGESGRAEASYAGFSVTSYKSTAATVKLLLKSDEGSAETVIRLRWSGGDWKVVPDANGGMHSPLASVQSTNGFLLWGV
ncbi:hypothetical protein ACIQM0_26985 [Streptomyces sp. NPDC091387]|uniref:hypothetical protein n=1 Tax=Streptomyces sp. NPDC091387 TaxID=3365998 RepID=UPI00380566FC